MQIKNSLYVLELNSENGAIQSLKNVRGKEFIQYSPYRDLFVLQFYNHDIKEFVKLSSNTAQFSVMAVESEKTILRYEQIGGLNISAIVTIRHPENEGLTYWNIQVQNNSALQLDKIDFPKVIVPNDLVATGGTGRVVTSMMEGILVEDVELRDRYKIPQRANDMMTGWRGAYPGACPTQFSAYYCDEGGLYFAAHDNKWNPKIIEYFKEDEGIKLEFKTYPGTDDTTNFILDYEMVLGVFEGDWYDAAELYRSFIETSGLITLPKLKDNQNIPNWLRNSPIIVCYPVRGQVDTEIVETDEWAYYPYTKATPYMKELQKELDSALMPLLMHWEGTAPWAPPYVWPPYGEFSNFEQFISEMHEMGNYVGVYCSGISWSQESILIPSYNKKEEFEKEGWNNSVIVGASQEMKYTWTFIRYSYELCPSCQQTKDVAISEFEKIIANSEVDYVQYFDQNLGGATYPCYAKHHNHPFGAGKWMNEEMLDIADGLHGVLEKYNKQDKVLIGCESNAAEPLVNRFIFNDSRHHINYEFGYPIPVYNYIFHEYVSNFMGNQCNLQWVFDFAKYPDNLFYRYAHSFAQGDVLTVLLKDKGKIHWGWCTPWNEPDVDQEAIKAFIRELNTWRKNVAKPALQYGKMIKPLKIDCESYKEPLKSGGEHNFPSIEMSCYLTETGKKQQMLINYLPFEQTIQVQGNDKIIVVEDANGNIRYELNDSRKIVIPARSVRMIEF